MAADLSEMERARLALVRGARASDPELFRSLHQLARVTAGTLNVERVGIWAIEDGWQRLRCVAAFDARTGECGSAGMLELSRYPAYCRALKERRVIAAEDARTDPRTRELTESYLERNGVRALLDSPVYEDGEVVAIVCHESVQSPRVWSERDRDFAASVSDMVSTLFAQVALIRFEAELRGMREALAEARVMDSLGRMATGVAHDFNNLLQGVAFAVNVLEQALPEGSTAHDAAKDATGLIQQGSRLVKSLLTFARQGARSDVSTDVNAALAQMLPRLRGLLGGDVELSATLGDQPAHVRLDSAMLDQIVLNLLLNARDAMPGGGDVAIATRIDGDSLLLSVRDTGIGMDAATRQRIFEPFFTTKGRAGTGLGLAIVFGAVHSAGGTIELESAPGQGSTFTLKLPTLNPTSDGRAPVALPR